MSSEEAVGRSGEVTTRLGTVSSEQHERAVLTSPEPEKDLSRHLQRAWPAAPGQVRGLGTDTQAAFCVHRTDQHAPRLSL